MPLRGSGGQEEHRHPINHCSFTLI